MCGRYVIIQKVDTIEKRFNVKANAQAKLFEPNHNVSIGQVAPVITGTAPHQLQLFTFGLTPFWAKKRMYLFNARTEGDLNKENDVNYSGGKGIINKPAFRKPIRSQRCLVLADCFIEGSIDEGLDKAYVVYLKDRRPFAMAGIWDQWQHPETHETIQSFAIITTVANSLMQKIPHHRSPVILKPEEEKRWLASEHLHEITDLLKPYPAPLMNAYPIDKAIKNSKNNDINLLNPIGERLMPESTFTIDTQIKLEGMGSKKR
ncbi:MAG: hypothetical protein RIQ89_1791 [Bacteroidota bacterium]|jgi:putative SOS response-associated peptidase YedK